MSKKITCGFLICSEQGFLALHPTGRKFEFGCFDIPKGCQEGSESVYATAVRELKEETGIDFELIRKQTDTDLYYFGTLHYLKDKDLALFVVEIPDFDKDFKFKCTSFFEDKVGKQHPEVDGFFWFKDLDYFFPSLRKVFAYLQESNKEFEEIVKRYEVF